MQERFGQFLCSLSLRREGVCLGAGKLPGGNTIESGEVCGSVWPP